MSPIIYGGGSGGGSMPAGSDGQIQFNDADAFGASAHFVWDDATKELRLVTTQAGLATIIANGLGVQLQITAGDGDATEVGGEIVVKSGDSAGQNGGDLSIVAGSDTAEGDGGNVTIASGTSGGGGDGGEISIRANAGAVAGGRGGQVLFQGGSGTGVGGGGDAIVKGGSTDGSVQLYSGDSNQAVELNNNGLFLPGAIDVSSLPTSNPGPGLMWSDAGTLKVGT